MKRKVIITGGCGYVGSSLIKYFYNYFPNGLDDLEIIIVDNCMFGYRHIMDFLKDGYITLYKKSVSKFVKENPKIDGLFSVIHLSGLSNDPMADYSPEANLKLNFKDTKTIYKFAVENKAERFIYASSASVYGFQDYTTLKETSALNPNSAYAESKVKSEEFIIFENAIPHTIFRKGTLMGVSPRIRFDLVVNTMVSSALRFRRIELYGGGENWRPLCSVNDAARLYAEAGILKGGADFDKFKNNIFNVCQSNYRISELGLRIGVLLKVPVIPRYDMPKDMRSYKIDGSKLVESTGFKYAYDVNQCVHSISREIRQNKIELDDPLYCNIRWLKNCERVAKILGIKYNLCE